MWNIFTFAQRCDVGALQLRTLKYADPELGCGHALNFQGQESRSTKWPVTSGHVTTDSWGYRKPAWGAGGCGFNPHWCPCFLFISVMNHKIKIKNKKKIIFEISPVKTTILLDCCAFCVTFRASVSITQIGVKHKEIKKSCYVSFFFNSF